MKKFLIISVVALLSLGIGFGASLWYQKRQDLEVFLPLFHFENKLSLSIGHLQQLPKEEQEKNLKELIPLVQAEAKRLYLTHQKSRTAVLFLMFQSPAAFVSQESLHTAYALFYEANHEFYKLF